MPRLLRFGFLDKDFTKTLTDEQHQQIFDLLHHFNEDHDDIPKDLDSMYPHFKKVMWQGLSFFPNWKYWESKRCDKENSIKIWQMVRERYRDLLKDGYNDVQIIRLLENEGWLETENDHFGVAYANGDEILAHKAILFAYRISLLFPKETMYLEDTFGWAIYCPLLLKGGMAKPDLKEIKDELDNIDEIKKRSKASKKFIIAPFINDSKNRIRYLKRILEIRPDWGDINQYIRPIDNYEGITGYRIIPTVKLSEMSSKEIEAYLRQFEKEEPGINTGFYDDMDWYPEI